MAKVSKKVLEMNDTFSQEDVVKYMKSFIFIKGFAVGLKLPQTIVALSLARRFHDGQYRKDGLPFVVHPLKVCCTLISYGIVDDTILAAALLHDVLEECEEKLPLKGRELISEYGISEEVYEIIELLTKEPGLDQYELSVYFKEIEKNPKAALIKLADRLHNSATMYTFSVLKMRKYISETSEFLVPMASYCKNYYPEYMNAFSILKSNIYSLNNAMRMMMEKFEVKCDEKKDSDEKECIENVNTI